MKLERVLSPSIALSMSAERVRERRHAEHQKPCPAYSIELSTSALSSVAPLPSHSFGVRRPLLGQGEVIEKREPELRPEQADSFHREKGNETKSANPDPGFFATATSALNDTMKEAGTRN